MASKKGRTAIVKILLERGAGATINHTDSADWCALYAAVHEMHVECVALLLEAGAEVWHGSELANPLSCAFSCGSLEIMSLFKLHCQIE